MWLGVIAMICLTAFELMAFYPRRKLLIDRGRLRNVAVVVSVLFLATVAVTIINAALSP
jgi:hypothetical protein